MGKGGKGGAQSPGEAHRQAVITARGRLFTVVCRMIQAARDRHLPAYDNDTAFTHPDTLSPINSSYACLQYPAYYVSRDQYYYYHHLRPLYRRTCVSRHPQLRTGGFCWSKVSVPTCPCWACRPILLKLTVFVHKIHLAAYGLL